MDVYSTKGLSPKIRREYWNDAICETFTDLVTDMVDDSHFHASLTSVSLGDITYARVQTTSSRVSHTKHHVSQTKENVLLLHLQLENESIHSQRDKEVFLQKGDFTLVESASPYRLEFNDPISMGVMKIPYEALRKRMPNPEALLGHKFSGSKNISGLLSQMLQSFWNQSQIHSNDTINRQLANSMLDLLVTSFQGQSNVALPTNSVRRARYIQTRKFIDYNLSDPELSPTRVAAIFKITPRYLHQVFAEFGNGMETVGQYILCRRLEECAHQFQSQNADHLRITDIAFTMGFNSMTHFSRVFKEKYSKSPRIFRKTAQQILTDLH